MPPSASATEPPLADPPRGIRAAIIMDGNGRWATAHGVNITDGHRAGGDALHDVTEAALDLGVSELTVYGFSTENWRRDPDEIAGIMQLFVELVDREAPIMLERGARMTFMGRRDVLGDEIRDRMRWAEELTAAGTNMTLCIAFNYGGRAEIVDAVRAALASGVAPARLDEDDVSRHLYRPELGEPDVIIRTAGERRTSNFLVWQGAYAEFVFADTLWPDFGKPELRAALVAYAQRERRFGGRASEVVS